MGDGKKLKEYLDEKGTNVRRIAKETGISATTVSYTHLDVYKRQGSPFSVLPSVTSM